jgi:hypothetical protein
MSEYDGTGLGTDAGGRWPRLPVYLRSILRRMNEAGIQTVLSVGIPTLAVLVAALLNNSRLGDLRAYMESRFSSVEKVMDAKFAAAKSDMERMEGVMDARLTRIEQELKIR